MELLPGQRTVRGPSPWFTGDVGSDVVARAEEPARTRMTTVRSAPCSRTAWHGAAPADVVVHAALRTSDDGTWGELVTDGEHGYPAGQPSGDDPGTRR